MSESTTLRPSDILAFDEVRKCWERVMRGGIIVCQSPGKAVNLRQRMYRYRRKVQGTNGATPYDDMIILLARGDNRLYVKKRDEGILEIIPDFEDAEITYEEKTITATRKHPDTESVAPKRNPTDPIIE